MDIEIPTTSHKAASFFSDVALGGFVAWLMVVLSDVEDDMKWMALGGVCLTVLVRLYIAVVDALAAQSRLNMARRADERDEAQIK